MNFLYRDCPRIRNELINRSSLSNQAAIARRNLIEKMLTSPEKPLLGIVGYPPERAIYESVLHAPGIHRLGTDGKWSFRAPQADHYTRLGPVWRKLELLVFGPAEQPIAVEQLFTRLAAPPYGVKEGLLPVLLCAFLQAHSSAIRLYRDGVHVFQPSAADFELLSHQPERFTL